MDGANLARRMLTRATLNTFGDAIRLAFCRLTVYCADCAVPICHHCALWDRKHEGHAFKDLAHVYDQHVEDIRSHLQELRARSGFFFKKQRARSLFISHAGRDQCLH